MFHVGFLCSGVMKHLLHHAYWFVALFHIMNGDLWKGSSIAVTQCLLLPSKRDMEGNHNDPE